MNQILFISLILLQLADVVTTDIALSIKGLRESMPVVKKLMEWFGNGWWVAKMGVVFLCIWVAPNSVTLSVATVYYLYVVANNTRLILKHG